MKPNDQEHSETKFLLRIWGILGAFWDLSGKVLMELPGSCASCPTHSLTVLAGPCRVTNAVNGTTFHPESWNSNANVFFVDQPIGVGFSYADYGEYVVRTAITLLLL